MKSQQEYRNDIEQDLDDIRYDLSRILIKVRELEEFLVSVRKQLDLTELRTNKRTSGLLYAEAYSSAR